MIKFWKEDFEYVSRFGTSDNYIYKFHVRGESANYLMNHYKLKFGCVWVCFNWPEMSFIVTSSNRNGDVDNTHTGDEKDEEKLYEVIKNQISADLWNYKAYMCDDWYHRDSRWK